MVTTALQLLETIEARGASVRVDGDMLRIKPVRLVCDLGDEIKRLKPELLAALSMQSTLRPNRLRWADVPHSHPPRPTDTPTDPARIQLANEIGHILTAFPNGGAKLLKSGDWRIKTDKGEIWEHDQAVMLASHELGHTVNGWPLEVTPSKLLTGDAVIEIQGDEIVAQVPQFSEVKS